MTNLVKCICGECRTCYRREWARKTYKANKVKRIAAVRKYQRTKKGKVTKKKADAKYRVAHAEQIAEWKRKRYHNNLEESRIKGRVYNYRRRGAGGEKELVRHLIETYKNCVLCGTDENLTIDHILPTTKGGKTVRENLQIMCVSCNSFKGTRLMLPGGGMLCQ